MSLDVQRNIEAARVAAATAAGYEGVMDEAGGGLDISQQPMPYMPYTVDEFQIQHGDPFALRDQWANVNATFFYVMEAPAEGEAMAALREKLTAVQAALLDREAWATPNDVMRTDISGQGDGPADQYEKIFINAGERNLIAGHVAVTMLLAANG